MLRSRSSSSDKVFNAFWVGTSLLWIPLCFINFDSHHDGIIITTIQQLKINISNGGPWPFNQYGSVWVFPYLLVSFVVPPNILLLSIRLLTVVFYIAATYLLYKSAKIAFNPKTARISVFLYLAFQPFLGPWNTSLLPWPSSFVVFLVALILYLMLISTGIQGEMVGRNLKVIGFLSAIILGSRIQVGILLLISISIIVFFLKIGRFRDLMFGIFLWLVPWSIFLQAKGWLLPSLYDQIILGGQFLGSDHLRYPLPTLSVLAGLCLSIWLGLALANRLSRWQHALFLVLALPATLLSVSRILGESFNLANYFSVTQRKLLAALFFAAVLVIVIELCKSFLQLRGINRDIILIRKTVVYLIGISSASQAWPFFDQMHIWWSFAPAVVVIAEKFSRISFIDQIILRPVFLSISFVFMFLLTLSQFSGSKTELKSINQNFVFVNQADEQNEIRVQQFIADSIPLGSRILNLCPNAYPFFILGQYESASRFFIYWSNFESAPIEYRDYDPAEISFVLACDTYLYQNEDLERYISRKQAILNSIPELKLVDLFRDGSFSWEVYSTE